MEREGCWPDAPTRAACRLIPARYRLHLARRRPADGVHDLLRERPRERPVGGPGTKCFQALQSGGSTCLAARSGTCTARARCTAGTIPCSVEKNRTVHMYPNPNRIKQRAQDSAATGRQKDLNLESVCYKVYSTSMEIEPWICPIEHDISFMNGPSRTRVQTICIHFAIWHAYPHWRITNVFLYKICRPLRPAWIRTMHHSPQPCA